MKTSKICLVVLCLLSFRTVGMPQFDGATFVMKHIFINSKKYGLKAVTVDDEDYELVSQFAWQIRKPKKTFYAIRDTYVSRRRGHKRERKFESMHRLIMGISDKKVYVDHKDHNGLNNQKSNLREATHTQNLANTYKYKHNGTSKYKGVSLEKTSGKWKARIGVGNKVIALGRFDKESDAAICYNDAALKYFGEFASINQL